jgi:hypothetical protein
MLHHDDKGPGSFAAAGSRGWPLIVAGRDR